MQLTLGRVYSGWCIFPLHNKSLTRTLTDHRFSSNHNTRWRLLNLNCNFMIKTKTFSFPNTSQEAKACHSMSPHDRPSWKTRSNEGFFRKLGQGEIELILKIKIQLRIHRQMVEWHDIVWFKNAIPRHSFLLWMAVQQKLTTQDRLHRFGIHGPNRCSLCLRNNEDHNHLFFECAYTKAIWWDVCDRCDIPRMTKGWD